MLEICLRVEHQPHSVHFQLFFIHYDTETGNSGENQVS